MPTVTSPGRKTPAAWSQASIRPADSPARRTCWLVRRKRSAKPSSPPMPRRMRSPATMSPAWDVAMPICSRWASSRSWRGRSRGPIPRTAAGTPMSTASPRTGEVRVRATATTTAATTAPMVRPTTSKALPMLSTSAVAEAATSPERALPRRVAPSRTTCRISTRCVTDRAWASAPTAAWMRPAPARAWRTPRPRASSDHR